MCCKRSLREGIDDGDAVSSIVGEMLMLTLVVILIGLVSVNAQSILPPPREPSVTVKMGYDDVSTTLTIYHKGGDPVEVDDLKIVVSKGDNQYTYCKDGSCTSTFTTDPGGIEIFDLGSSVSADLSPIDPPFAVKVATSRSVLFTGEVR